MDGSHFLASLLSTQTPVLPAAGVVRLYLAVSWALVLAALGNWLGGRLPWLNSPRRRGGLAALLAFWALWPGALSPTYWLGLAFQMPSLTSVLLCVLLLASPWRPAWVRPAHLSALRRAAWGGIVLGWALLLDTFAAWPLSLYAVGFSPVALVAVVLLASLPWLLAGEQGGGVAVFLLLGSVLLLQVLLRLPSGNVWDAVLDPWLWAVLQLDGLRRLWRPRSASASA